MRKERAEDYLWFVYKEWKIRIYSQVEDFFTKTL